MEFFHRKLQNYLIKLLPLRTEKHNFNILFEHSEIPVKIFPQIRKTDSSASKKTLIPKIFKNLTKNPYRDILLIIVMDKENSPTNELSHIRLEFKE